MGSRESAECRISLIARGETLIFTYGGAWPNSMALAYGRDMMRDDRPVKRLIADDYAQYNVRALIETTRNIAYEQKVMTFVRVLATFGLPAGRVSVEQLKCG